MEKEKDYRQIAIDLHQKLMDERINHRLDVERLTKIIDTMNWSVESMKKAIEDFNFSYTIFKDKMTEMTNASA